MAVSRIVQPITSSQSITIPTPNFSFVIPDSTKRYVYNEKITAGSYTLTCPSANIVTAYFHNATNATENSAELKFSTTSGTVTFLLENDYDLMTASLNTGTSISCTLTRNSSYELYKSSVLDTITSTSTYNETGNGLVLVIGGGQGGSFSSGATNGGPGGHSGKAVVKFSKLNGSIPVVIGSGGTLGLSNNSPAGNSGGSTIFGNISAFGGSPTNIGSSGGAGGPFNGPGNHAGGGGAVNGGNGAATGSGFSIAPYSIVTSGPGGNGGARGQLVFINSLVVYNGGQGGPGGIYAGGGGGGSAVGPSQPANYQGSAGHGGGGGGGLPGSGTTGGPGAVYVLRFPE